MQRLRAASRGCLAVTGVFRFRHFVGAGRISLPRSYFRCADGPERPRISDVDHVGALIRSLGPSRRSAAIDRSQQRGEAASVPCRSQGLLRRWSVLGSRRSVRKKRRRTRRRRARRRPGRASRSTPGGLHTVTGTDVLRPSPALVRTASVAIRRPDSSARILGGPEFAPRNTLTLTASIAPFGSEPGGGSVGSRRGDAIAGVWQLAGGALRANRCEARPHQRGCSSLDAAAVVTVVGDRDRVDDRPRISVVLGRWT